ncbi:MAG: SIR2 family protein [Lentisphaerae bacterium]|nr:SIR2 family protein [Lentisphaerota bacterium]
MSTNDGVKRDSASVNILKTRDDSEPAVFESPDAGNFSLSSDSECPSWLKDKDTFGPQDLRPRIEPWLTALFQSEHFSLLAGSGLTHAVHGMARNSPLPGMSKADFSVFQPQIDSAAKNSALTADRGDGNVEDQIRVVNELLVGLEHYAPPSATFWGSGKLKAELATLKREITVALHDFAASILNGERSIATADPAERERAFTYLVNFLMSFASRTGTRDRLQVFTTNYDRLLEAGAEVAGLHLMDRFVGSLTPVFRSSRLGVDMHYNPPGIRGEPRYLEGVARFTKLHGSVDWVRTGRDIRRVGMPFGCELIEPFLAAPGFAGASACDLMIYPNAAKDRETASYPYVELFRDFASAVCRPNSTLVTYGYSFGDEHINRVIRDMLTIPSTHLVVISRDDPMGRIMKTYNTIGRRAQTTLLVGQHLGDLKTLVDHYLPKPAIDRTTFRMAELLKSRFGTNQASKHNEGGESEGGGE